MGHIDMFEKQLQHLLLGAIFLLIHDVAWAQSPMQITGHTISGKKVTFANGSVMYYYQDGRYRFEGRGRETRGSWSVVNDGSVCIAFVNGSRRCDVYHGEGSTLYLENSRGTRFKIIAVDKLP